MTAGAMNVQLKLGAEGTMDTELCVSGKPIFFTSGSQTCLRMCMSPTSEVLNIILSNLSFKRLSLYLQGIFFPGTIGFLIQLRAEFISETLCSAKFRFLVCSTKLKIQEHFWVIINE